MTVLNASSRGLMGSLSLPAAVCSLTVLEFACAAQGVSTDPEKLGPRAAQVEGKTMLQLLRDCSGAFRPGILTALVGSSGAGKTTLMDVLAGRKTSEAPSNLCG